MGEMVERRGRMADEKGKGLTDDGLGLLTGREGGGDSRGFKDPKRGLTGAQDTGQ